jgi:uncharacterized protein (TIGR02452 family)
MDRMQLATIASDTIQQTKEICKVYPKEIKESIDKTIKYADVRDLAIQPDKKLDKKEECKVEVVYGDTADVAYGLLQSGLNPLILNMASDICPGGGWRKGALAQEESLFLRSTYHLALSRNYYPLDLYSAIYTPNVFFFRSNVADGCKVLPYEECAFMSCVAVAAIRNPKLKPDGSYRPCDERIMTEKIIAMFKIAALHNHDSIVLGAFGCGAFHNDPQQVARLFRNVVTQFNPYFKRITFAILDSRGSNNFGIFKQIIDC